MRAVSGVLLAAAIVAVAGGSVRGGADVSSRLLAAAKLQAAGEHREAIALFEQLREIDPRNEQVLYGLALSLYAVGEYHEAAHVGTTLLAESKSAPADLYALVGGAYGQLGSWKESESILDAGLEVWPDSQALHIQHAVGLEGLGRIDEAIVELEGCLKRSPYDAALWRALGDALSEASSPGRAFAAYVRSLTLDGDDAQAKAVAASLWAVLFRGAAGSSPSDAAEKAEAKGLALIAALRHERGWSQKSDASFFAYALDTSLRLVSALHGKETKDLFWGPFVLDYFDEVRAAGHMEALAYDIRRATGDPDVARWRALNSQKVTAFRNWSERWSVHWSEVPVRSRGTR